MKRRVGYYYDDELGNVHYAYGHPLKPQRVRMTHELLRAYGLLELMSHVSLNQGANVADVLAPSEGNIGEWAALDAPIEGVPAPPVPAVPVTDPNMGVGVMAQKPPVCKAGRCNEVCTCVEDQKMVEEQLRRTVVESRKIWRSTVATDAHLSTFHTDDMLANMRLWDVGSTLEAGLCGLSERWSISDDCPAFHGLWRYARSYTGGSLSLAALLAEGQIDTGINWAGGLHHAKKTEPSGFCYANDCVLAALELLKYGHRVLYVDIDVHHGDGVEEAFYTSDRVLCVSFHKYGDFFPGTGALADVGAGRGRGYSVNVPLNAGVDDALFAFIFDQVMSTVVEQFRPTAVILQSGADSLAGDRLGSFNLTADGHAHAARFFALLKLPVLQLGGGGYTLRNVPRCWALETGVHLGVDLDRAIPPETRFRGYFGPNYSLDLFPNARLENANAPRTIHKLLATIQTTLREQVKPTSTQISATNQLDEHPWLAIKVLPIQVGQEEVEEGAQEVAA